MYHARHLCSTTRINDVISIIYNSDLLGEEIGWVLFGVLDEETETSIYWAGSSSKC